MYLYLLLFTILTLLIGNFLLFNRDLLAPPVIVCAVFLISCICSIYNYQFWQFTIHQNTYLTIVYGLVLFSIASFAADNLFKALYPPVKRMSGIRSGLQIIKVSHMKLAIVNIITFAISIWYAMEIIKIAGRYGYMSSISDITSIYRRVAAYGLLSNEEDINMICRQLYKMVVALSYVSLYIFINNVIVSKKIKKNIHVLIPCIIYMIMSLISAGRYQLIKVVSAAIFLYYILYMKHTDYKSRIGIKFLIRCLEVLVIFCIVFFKLGNIVGRDVNKDPLYYITSYAGGSIPLLDSFLQYPPVKSNIFGKESFYSINNFIGRYFKINKLQYITHHEFRTAPTGINMGNVYTVFRRMIYDFGYSGMTVLYSFCAVFYTVIYNKIKLKPISGKVELGIIFYSYISFGLTMQFYEDAFYSSIISVNTLATFIMIYVCKILFVNVTWGKSKKAKGRPIGNLQADPVGENYVTNQKLT